MMIMMMMMIVGVCTGLFLLRKERKFAYEITTLLVATCVSPLELLTIWLILTNFGIGVLSIVFTPVCRVSLLYDKW